MMIEHATPADVDALVALESALFREDAGVHEPHVDVTWPLREGRADFERLLADDSSVVLVARGDSRVVGFLVGYESGPSPTRPHVTTGYLRSLYVDPDHRRAGVAAGLVDRFLGWATERGCASACVESYAANHPAQRLYERLGFVVQSVTRVHSLA